MESVLRIVYLTIVSIVSAVGILASVFIVAVNILDWINHKSLNTCDRILLTLGISSFFAQFTLALRTYVYRFWNAILEWYYVCAILTLLQTWSWTSSFWLTACLCVFYCAKITNFSHSLFIWLKLRISKVVTWLLRGSVVGCLVLSIPSYITSYQVFLQTKSTNVTDNSSCFVCELIDASSYIAAMNIFSLVPLLLCMACIALILISLCRHTQQIKENLSGFSKPRQEAHFAAIRLLGALFIINAFTFMALCFLQFSSLVILHRVAWILFTSSDSAQSISLILGNTKLRNVLWKVLTPWRK